MTEAPLARILIVDDEAAQLQALCDTLRDHGYETVGFGTGTAALLALQETRFDLLLGSLPSSLSQQPPREKPPKSPTCARRRKER